MTRNQLLRTEHPVVDDLTIIVPTLGRPVLEGCLRSIAAGTVWPVKLLAVDQGRSIDTRRWVDEMRALGLNAVHVPSDGRSVAAGLNLGIRHVRTARLAVTHDDCVVSETWLATMEASLRRAGERTVITGRVEPRGEGSVPSVTTSDAPAVHTRPGWRDVLFPANMGMATEVAHRVGPFDEHPLLRWAEDNDWAYRALRSDVTIRYDPDVVVGHVDWRGSEELEETQRRYIRSQGAFYGKWIRRGDPFILARALRGLVDGPLVMVRGAVTRRREMVARGWLSVRNLAPGILAGIRARDWS